MFVEGELVLLCCIFFFFRRSDDWKSQVLGRICYGLPVPVAGDRTVGCGTRRAVPRFGHKLCWSLMQFQDAL